MTGQSWVVQSPTGRAPGDHVCWLFRGRGELAEVAAAYLTEGLARHERVAYVGPGHIEELRRDLAGIPNLETHLERGRLEMIDVATLPGSDPSSAVADELIDLAAMTRDALAAGYTGLRLLANGTTRAADQHRRAQLVRYEHLIDRFCRGHAFTCLCALDVAALDEDAIAELGCVHTLTGDELSPFQLPAARDADAALVGSVDAFCATQLVQALTRIGLPQPGGRATIDVAGLEFIDARALVALNRHAAALGATLVLRSPPSIVRRLLALVHLPAIQPERV